MSRVGRIVLFLAVALLVLGLALALVSVVTGGNFSRIVSTTDLTDYTKFVSQEQLDAWGAMIRSVFHLG